MTERRTLIRRRRDAAEAGVLRGDTSIFEGRIVEAKHEHQFVIGNPYQVVHPDGTVTVHEYMTCPFDGVREPQSFMRGGLFAEPTGFGTPGQPTARCPIPQCDRPAHDGLHEDEAGFRWRQDEQAEWAWKP